jgi:hypothetical protein
MGYVKALSAAAACAFGLLTLLGCSGSSIGAGGSPTPTSLSTKLPTLGEQIRRAQQASPGEMDWCPLFNAVARAHFSIDVPGGGTVSGTCETRATRGAHSDSVTFIARWDARAYRRGTGTFMLGFSVPHVGQGAAPPVATLISQSGSMPP